MSNPRCCCQGALTALEFGLDCMPGLDLNDISLAPVVDLLDTLETEVYADNLPIILVTVDATPVVGSLAALDLLGSEYVFAAASHSNRTQGSFSCRS